MFDLVILTNYNHFVNIYINIILFYMYYSIYPPGAVLLNKHLFETKLVSNKKTTRSARRVVLRVGMFYVVNLLMPASLKLH